MSTLPEIPESEFSISFVRGAGPGGQNVNKVSTTAQLRFNLAATSLLDAAGKTRLRALAGHRLVGEGEILIVARNHRTQEGNRREALGRLQELIVRALHVPKSRRPTRPTRASKERRIAGKLHRQRNKQLRRAVRHPLPATTRNQRENHMISIGALWLPILLSAVFVFVLSSIIHMFLGYHFNDLRAPAQQDAILDALRGLNLQPGDYAMPKPDSMQQFRTPEFKAKMERGPMVLMTVAKGGMAMGKNLLQWFVYLLVVSFFCAYIAGRELPAGAPYLSVFRLVGFAAFMAYAMALPQAAIWYHRNWRMTLATMFDGLLFGLLTGGTFGWLWPH